MSEEFKMMEIEIEELQDKLTEIDKICDNWCKCIVPIGVGCLCHIEAFRQIKELSK